MISISGHVHFHTCEYVPAETHVVYDMISPPKTMFPAVFVVDAKHPPIDLACASLPRSGAVFLSCYHYYLY